MTFSVVYYGDSLEPHRNSPSVYLDGPKSTVSGLSWRKKLFEILQQQGFTWTVIIPECRKDNQVPPYGTEEFYHWETVVMEMASTIMFWMPRDSSIFPARDMNDRWGHYKHEKNIILGYPPRTENINYQGWYAKKHGITMVHSLENMAQYIKAVLDQFAKLEFAIAQPIVLSLPNNDNLALSTDNNGVGIVEMPPSEEVISNVFLKKMIQRMGKSFISQVQTIRVPWSNTSCISVINSCTENIYLPNTVNPSTEMIELVRRDGWENIWKEPTPMYKDQLQQYNEAIEAQKFFETNIEGSSTENTPVIKTVTPEQQERLMELIELKKRLNITNTDLKVDEYSVYDKNVIDNDQYREVQKPNKQRMQKRN